MSDLQLVRERRSRSGSELQVGAKEGGDVESERWIAICLRWFPALDSIFWLQILYGRRTSKGGLGESLMILFDSDSERNIPKE